MCSGGNAPPPARAAGGQPGRCPTFRRSRRETRAAAHKASTAQVARPLEPPCGVSGMGRGIERGWRASSPARWRVAIATVEPPTPWASRWKRLLLSSDLPRRSARRSQEPGQELANGGSGETRTHYQSIMSRLLIPLKLPTQPT